MDKIKSKMFQRCIITLTFQRMMEKENIVWLTQHRAAFSLGFTILGEFISIIQIIAKSNRVYGILNVSRFKKLSYNLNLTHARLDYVNWNYVSWKHLSLGKMAIWVVKWQFVNVSWILNCFWSLICIIHGLLKLICVCPPWCRRVH